MKAANILRQKMRTTAYASFRLARLVATYVCGIIIVLTAYLLEPISTLTRRTLGRGSYGDLEWSTNATLQLQRLAHEAIGMGTWRRGTEYVPVTRPGEMLGLLDISNALHPRLHGAWQSDGEEWRGKGGDVGHGDAMSPKGD